MGCALAFPLFLKYWNWILYTHNLALIKVKSDRMVIATVQWLFITNVTWQKFDLSAKYTVVGHRTIRNANKCPQHWWGEAASPCESLSISTDGHAWSCICLSTSKSKMLNSSGRDLDPTCGSSDPTSRHLDRFSSFCMVNKQEWQTDRQTDHATCSVTMRATRQKNGIILFRLAEKIFVQQWLRPALSMGLLKDQYAFRPTGSTCCSMVDFIHHSTFMLENNSYIRCLFIDF